MIFPSTQIRSQISLFISNETTAITPHTRFQISAIGLSVNPNIQKRQQNNVQFVGNSGYLQSSCASEIAYILQNGMLYEQSGGTTLQFTASNTDIANGYAAFSPRTSPNIGPNDVTSSFFVTSSGELLWANGAFYGNGASWCSDDATGQLIVVYMAPSDFQQSYVNGCSPVQLIVAAGTTCATAAGSGMLRRLWSYAATLTIIQGLVDPVDRPEPWGEFSDILLPVPELT